jgi:hypothetical protein
VTLSDWGLFLWSGSAWFCARAFANLANRWLRDEFERARRSDKDQDAGLAENGRMVPTGGHIDLVKSEDETDSGEQTQSDRRRERGQEVHFGVV